MFSTTLSDGDAALASQYNNLRLDVFDATSGHNHDGTSSGGKKVGHSDLVDDGYIPNTYLTHAMLNKHVQGGSGTQENPDADGGDSGVHGLASGIKVAGSYSSQLVIQGGSGTFGSAVTFPTPFTSVVSVIIQLKTEPTAGSYPTESYFTAGPSTTGFTATLKSQGALSFYWIAIGTK